MTLYLDTLVASAALGVDGSRSQQPSEGGYVSPVLVTLLYMTFLGVPLYRLWTVFGDAQLTTALVAVNSLVAPTVVPPLSQLVVDESGLPTSTSLVLLTPYVDYVMVFTRLASSTWSRILAASPVLMLL